MRRGDWGWLPAGLLALLLVVGPVAAEAASGSDQMDRVYWQGEIHLDSPTIIPADTELVVAPGSRILPTSVGPPGAWQERPALVVQGSLQAMGQAGQRIEFHVPITLEGSEGSGSLIREALFAPGGRPADCGLTVHGSRAYISDSAFQGATDGLCIRPGLDSNPTDPQLAESDGAKPVMPGSQNRAPGISPLGEGALIPGPSEEQLPPSGPFLPRVPPSTILLRSNQYTGHPGAGLNISFEPTASHASPLTVVSDGGRYLDNGIGIRAASPGTSVHLSNATIGRNDVGLLATNGSQVHLDHATFAENDRWDIYTSGEPSHVRWRGSYVEPSCVHVEGHDAYGCQRGSVGGVTVLTILLGILYSLAFLISEAGRYLLTRLWIWLRLYSRIPKDELLDDETRQLLLELVRDDPGRHLRDLAREVGSYGRTVYHLRRMENEGFIFSRREGYWLRFYPTDADPDKRESKSVREHVQDAIEQTPGIHAAEIARRIDTSRQLVSYHVGKLLEIGRIESKPGERVHRLYPAGRDVATGEPGSD